VLEEVVEEGAQCDGGCVGACDDCVGRVLVVVGRGLLKGWGLGEGKKKKRKKKKDKKEKEKKRRTYG
jgi:hypothetical protein